MEIYNGKPLTKLTDFDLDLDNQAYYFIYNGIRLRLYQIKSDGLWQSVKNIDWLDFIEGKLDIEKIFYAHPGVITNFELGLIK